MGIGGAPVTPVDKDGNVIGPSGGTGPSSAQIGSLTETAPATDTASSGLNGRLQRIAQRLTSLIALLPASLGAKTGALSLSVVPNTDTAFPVVGNVATDAADTGNPVKIGAQVVTTPSSATVGNRTDLTASIYRKLLTLDCGILSAPVRAQANFASGLARSDGAEAGGGYPLRVQSNVSNGTTLDPVFKSNSTGRLLAAANTTNATSVKASPGELFKIRCKAAAAVFLKLYNKASAPTVGTDTPVMTFALAVGDNSIDFGGAHYFSTGIAYALTGAAADADTTAVAANDVTCLNINYA